MPPKKVNYIRDLILNNNQDDNNHDDNSNYLTNSSSYEEARSFVYNIENSRKEGLERH
ncbi:hypothetical protein N9W34_03315 [Rickettsiales bacterium]|nr:hypothetical protein [Rickettsiales bacterium]